MTSSSVQKAVSIFGGQAELARAIGASPSMVHQWIKGIRPVSAERCIDIDSATSGEVTCEEIRPDLICRWSYLRRETAVVVWLRQRHPQVLAEFEQCRDEMREAA